MKRGLLRLATTAVAGVGAVYASRTLRERRKISFLGRSVVIAGGSRGLGLVMARELALEGAHLTLLARTAADLERAERELTAHGATVLTIVCDIRSPHEVQQAIAQVIERFGRIDVLINNAGIIAVGPVEHMNIDDFENAMAVHLWGPLYTMQAVVPHMRQQGGGRIVNISSIGGKVAVPHLVPYSASKFALVGLSDGMRAELAKDDIRVTTVIPGLMRTGSPPNVQVKGKHQPEYAWFAIGDALPVASIDAQRAARQVLEATRYGDPQLIISIQAQVLAMLNALTPGLIANIMALTNRLLPGPTGAEGNETRSGWQSQSSLAPSVLTRLSDRATEENNELRGRRSVE